MLVSPCALTIGDGDILEETTPVRVETFHRRIKKTINRKKWCEEEIYTSLLLNKAKPLDSPSVCCAKNMAG